jgi:peptidase M15-like protein
MPSLSPYDQFAPPAGPGAKPPTTESPGQQRADAAIGSEKLQPDIHELARGGTLGFVDDIDAAYEQAGTAFTNLVHHVRGEKSPYSVAEAGIAARKATARAEQEYESRHPLVAGAENLLGGAAAMADPFERPLAGAAVPKLLGGAVKGGLLGAAAGFGYGKGSVQERARGAAEGAATGAAFGGAVEVGGAAATKAIKPLIAHAQAALDRLRLAHGIEPGAAPSPKIRARAEQTGREQVRQMAERHDPSGARLGANRVEASGKPVTAAEALGRSAEARLGAIGRREGQTPDALEAQLRTRHAETADRVVKDFGELTGVDPESVEGDFTKANEKLRTQASPLYDRAYASGPVDSPTLQGLLKRPAIEDALVAAREIAGNEGRNPDDVGLVQREAPVVVDGKPLMRGGKPIMMPGGQSVQVKSPSMQTWDYIKRGLDAVLERRKVNGVLPTDPSTRAIQTALRDLRSELTNPDTHWGPAYAAALEAGGEAPRQEEAFAAAKRLFSGTVSESDFNKQIKRFSPAQMQAFRAGIVNQVRDAARAGRQALGQMATASYKAKLERVFGKQTADELSQRIQDERDLMAHGNRMTPGIGAVTSESLFADSEQREAAKLTLSAGRKALSGDLWGAVSHVVGSMITGARDKLDGPMGEAERDVVGALLSQKPSELAAVLAEHGTPPAQTSRITWLMQQAGMFSPRITAALAAQMGHAAAEPAPAAPKNGSDILPAPDPNSPYAKFANPGAASSAPAAPVAASGAPAPVQGSMAPQPVNLRDEPAAFTPNAEVKTYLQDVLGSPVSITSGYRSPEHNAEVGGAEHSAHTRGEAYDFKVEGLGTREAGEKLARSGILFDQIEITPTHVHVSFDPQNRGSVIYVGMSGPAPAATPRGTGGQDFAPAPRDATPTEAPQADQPDDSLFSTQ